MTFTVTFEGGLLDGEKISWKDRYIVFCDELYSTVFEGDFKIPHHYKYMGKIKTITMVDIYPERKELVEMLKNPDSYKIKE